jgi:hypothetical protein
MSSTTDFWNKKAQELLLNKKIIKVEYMDSKEAKNAMWDNRPVRIILEDGTNIFPMRDDEGNDGGALWLGNNDLDEVLPVLRGND